jgi:hypothetical protein
MERVVGVSGSEGSARGDDCDVAAAAAAGAAAAAAAAAEWDDALDVANT